MAEKVQKGDFVEVDYTGKLTTGEVFDTTIETVAKDNGIFNEKSNFQPSVICVGEGQVLPGLDQDLEGKELGKEHTIKIPAELAFGKRDVKKVKIVPASTFKEHNIQPQKGLQVDVDGEMGLITGMSGGRVIVNFNHPLSGKEVEYTFTVLKKVTDPKVKLESFLNTTMRLPKENVKIEVKEDKAEIELPFQLPPQFTEAMAKKLAELVKLKEVKIKASSKGTTEGHVHGPECRH
ncbi:MAG: peptidylprolyl isomerase [Candidatus Woesearchaeota archaeon]